MQPTKKPAGVWVILILYSLSVVWTLLSFWLVYSVKVSVPDATAEYLRNTGALTRVLTVVGMVLSVAFLVALFRMRRVSRTIFTIHLVVQAFSYLWSIMFANYLSSLTVASSLGVITGWVVLIAIALYLRLLDREGKLT
jgi:hypothetical protein